MDGSEVIDSFSDLMWGSEVCPSEGLLPEDTEPYLYLVQPGSMGGRIEETDILISLEPSVIFGFVGIEVIQNNIYFLIRVGSNNILHKIEEFPTSTTFVMARLHQPGGDLQRSK